MQTVYDAQFQHLVNLSSCWCWEQDADFRFSFAAVAELIRNGLPPEALAGKRRQELPITHIHEAEWEQHRLILEQRRPFRDYTYQVVGERGELRFFSISGEPILDAAGDFKGYRCVGRDVTEIRQAQQRQEMEHIVTRVLAESESLAAAMPQILRTICQTLAWDCGAYWTLDEQQLLRCAGTWSLPNGTGPAEFMALSSELTFVPDQAGLIRRALVSEEPVWISDAASDPTFSRAAQAAAAGLHGALAFPLLSAGTAIGVMEFYSRHIRQSDPILIEATRSIGAQIGQFIRSQRAEDARRISEERLSGVIHSAMRAVIMVDEDMNIVLFNPAAEAIFGHAAADMIGANIERLIPARFSHAHHKYVTAFGASKTNIRRMNQRGTIYGLRANGEEFPGEASISHLTLDGRKFYTVILSDITERVKAEETRARLATIVENANEAIVSRAPDGTILTWNAAAERLYGYTAAEAVGRDLVLPPPDLLHEHGFFRERARAGTPVMNYETARIARDGRRFEVSLSMSPIADGSGNAIGFAVFARDITERKQAEVARTMLAAIVESSHDAIISRRLDGKILSWNAGAEHLLGYSAAEAIGQPMAIIWPPEPTNDIAGNTSRLNRGESVQAFETQRRHKDGRLIEVWATLSPIRNDTGEVTGAAAILSDISQLKRAERELRHKAALMELLEALARAANEADTPEAAMKVCLNRICAYGNWTLGHFGIYAPGQLTGASQASFWHGKEQGLYSEFIRRSDKLAHNVAHGQFTGRALREQQPVWVEDLTRVAGFGRLDLARSAGIRAGFVFPVIVSGEPAAFLEFFAGDAREPDTLLLEALGSVASQLARLIERGRAEVARGQLAAIVEGSHDAIFSRTLDGFITSWNAGAERIFGFTASEVIGRPAGFNLPPGRRHNLARNTEQIRRGEATVPHESTRMTRDGRAIDVLTSHSPIRDSAGNIVGASVILHDITVFKQAEAARAELAAIVENSNNAIISRTFDGRILTWNAGAERMFGYSASEAIGKLISFNTPPGRAPIFSKFTERILRGERLTPHETQRLNKDGQVLDVLSSISPIKNDAGEIIAIASIFQDITALKRAEAARRESEQRFDAAFEQAGVGMGLRDLDPLTARWLRVNQKLCDILGYTKEELLQITTVELTPPEDQDIAIDYNQRLLRGEIRDYSREKRYLRKDGGIIWTNLTIAPISGPDGRPTHIISVVEDITERKRAREEIVTLNAELEQRVIERTRQLEVTNKELETFSYSVSHDLRAPLRGIDGFSRLLLKEYGDRLDTKAGDYLQRIHRATRRMGELIDDLLQLSKVSRHQIVPEKVDLSRLAGSILAELGERDPERTVATEIQDGIVVQGDPKLLRIMLENLLGNAWKFTQKTPHPRISMGTSEQDGRTVIRVSDNGAGFNMEYAHKLFGAFQRLHRATEFEGTGIGLATVQRIVTLHGGRVWAEAAVGKGAVFYLIL